MRRFKNAEEALEAARQDGLALRFVPEEMKTEEVCLAAVQSTGWRSSSCPGRRRRPPSAWSP